MVQLNIVERNMRLAVGWAGALARYGQAVMDEAALVAELRRHVSEDIILDYNHRPADVRLAPLFVERRGVADLVERFRFEKEVQRNLDGDGAPFDMATSTTGVYYTQHNAASFFHGPLVKWDAVTKLDVRDGKIVRVSMFLDGAMIDAAYPGGESG